MLQQGRRTKRRLETGYVREVHRGLKRRTVAVKGDSGNQARGRQRKDGRTVSSRRRDSSRNKNNAYLRMLYR